MSKKGLLDKVPPEVADELGMFGITFHQATQLEFMANYTDKTWAKWDVEKIRSIFLDEAKLVQFVKDLEMIYCGLALAGEVGEMCNLMKKDFREKYLTKGHADPEAIDKIPFETADIMYYLLRISKVLDIDLEKAFYEKMEQNIKRYVE